MRRLTRILIVLAVAATAGRTSRAGEPDAAELAAQIDRHIDTRLKAEQVGPADPADDAEFLRRVYLDLHGVIPTAEQAQRFLSDTDPKRRDKLIGALLAGPGLAPACRHDREYDENPGQTPHNYPSGSGFAGKRGPLPHSLP